MYPFNNLFLPFPQPRPIKMDSAFPAVFWDKDFAYDRNLGEQLPLEAIKDADLAFGLIETGWYQPPSLFSTGIRKISAIVGEEITLLNVKSIRHDLEAKTSSPRHPPQRMSWLQKFKTKFLTQLSK